MARATKTKGSVVHPAVRIRTQGEMFTPDIGVTVRPIKTFEAYPFLLEIHYAKRIPSITYAYGLFNDGEIVGVVTYGTPSSSPLRSGVCGQEYAGIVLELNRLCLLHNKKNDASRLVSGSLKMLPKPSIVISFADTEQGHIGYVYQACNFIYTGPSAKRTDWKIKGLEHLHGQSIADEFRGSENRSEAMRAKYGDRFYLKQRSTKHRYVALLGSKTQKKMMNKALKYPVCAYPKREVTG